MKRDGLEAPGSARHNAAARWQLCWRPRRELARRVSSAVFLDGGRKYDIAEQTKI